MHIRKVGTVRCTVGEGPLWDAETRSLYFVDLVGQKLWQLDPASEHCRSFAMPGFAVTATHDRTGRLLVVLADGIHALDRDSGALTLVARPELPAGTQFNDAKVDRQGRIVVLGADAGLKDPIASSYGFGFDGDARVLDHGFAIGNGPCWSPDGATFYSADSVAKAIYAYDYDTATGAVSNRRLFADTTDLGGIPDGATVDTNGNIWMAMCGAGIVAVFSPDGVVIDRIAMPTAWVSSVIFGGPAQDRLYVTTLDPSIVGLEPDEGCGYLYVVEGLDATGIPEVRARLDKDAAWNCA